MTMYEFVGFIVSNPINRYKRGSNTTGLYYNPDGSLTIYIQYAGPTSEPALNNWLPAPDGALYLITRLYIPATLTPPYVPPVIKKE